MQKFLWKRLRVKTHSKSCLLIDSLPVRFGNQCGPGIFSVAAESLSAGTGFDGLGCCRKLKTKSEAFFAETEVANEGEEQRA